jgi:hypothetical protein
MLDAAGTEVLWSDVRDPRVIVARLPENYPYLIVVTTRNWDKPYRVSLGCPERPAPGLSRARVLGDEIDDIPDRIHQPVVRCVPFQLVQDFLDLWRKDRFQCGSSIAAHRPPKGVITVESARGGCAESQSLDGQGTHLSSLTCP